MTTYEVMYRIQPDGPVHVLQTDDPRNDAAGCCCTYGTIEEARSYHPDAAWIGDVGKMSWEQFAVRVWKTGLANVEEQRTIREEV